jgi:hypothetical protein
MVWLMQPSEHKGLAPLIGRICLSIATVPFFLLWCLNACAGLNVVAGAFYFVVACLGGSLLFALRVIGVEGADQFVVNLNDSEGSEVSFKAGEGVRLGLWLGPAMFGIGALFALPAWVAYKAWDASEFRGSRRAWWTLALQPLPTLAIALALYIER